VQNNFSRKKHFAKKIMAKNDYKYGSKYKFRDMKFHSSSEWMANSTKKYRRVFDKAELTYMRFEFSFYNKLFDEEEWTAKVNLKVFNLSKNREEVFDQEEKRVIKTEENVVYIYKSWGVATAGGFWERGEYICEAYIDGKLVGSQNFYVEDVGLVTESQNPYFDIESVKLYAGNSDAWQEEEKRYLKKFYLDETQYVWVELKIRNKVQTAWNFEYFINIYDDAGLPKAYIETLKYIESGKKDMTFTFDRGWGSNEPGTWKNDKYIVEIVFMETLVAVVPFEMGNEEEEGVYEYNALNHLGVLQQQVATNEDSDETLEDVIKRLDELIGLQEVKKKIKEHVNYLEFIKLRREKGFEDSENFALHSVFTGNPGTGKTTVVKLLGKIYRKMGLLSKGHVLEVDRAELVGEFIGQTAPKVKKAIEDARGGILFIDEAYSLARAGDDAKDYGKEVIEVLVKEMSDGIGDIAIMVAGYPKEMQSFIDSNPGLKSRFKYYFHFDDYFPEELREIARYACEKRGVKLSPEAIALAEKMLTEAFRNRDNSFGNARYAYAIIDEGKMNMGLRLMKLPDVKNLEKETLSTIEAEDLKKIIETKRKKMADIAVDENLLRDSLKELNTLVGLDSIKNEVNELTKLVRYYRESGRDVLNKFSLHTVFTGNPGTGKTTIARIIGKIYKALGLLERGHVVEAGREGFIAGYIGQTALKTKERIDEAMGGVLFIDEAYALSEGGSTGFGNEAIEVILKNMEDLRGKFAVIAAGYPDNMEIFLRANPGLKSRFDRVLHFNDYSPEELYSIAEIMFAAESLTPDKEAEEHIKNYLGELHRKRDKFFGNARSVRKLVEKSIKNQHLRMASIASGTRTTEMMETITIDDVHEFVPDESRKGGVGFKRN